MGSLLCVRCNKWDHSKRDMEIKIVIWVCVRPLFLPVPFWEGEIWAEYSVLCFTLCCNMGRNDGCVRKRDGM